jgi:hypothetical protein
MKCREGFVFYMSLFYVASVAGSRGPLQNHLVRTTVVPLRRIRLVHSVSQLCS